MDPPFPPPHFSAPADASPGAVRRVRSRAMSAAVRTSSSSLSASRRIDRLRCSGRASYVSRGRPYADGSIDRDFPACAFFFLLESFPALAGAFFVFATPVLAHDTRPVPAAAAAARRPILCGVTPRGAILVSAGNPDADGFFLRAARAANSSSVDAPSEDDDVADDDVLDVREASVHARVRAFASDPRPASANIARMGGAGAHTPTPPHPSPSELPSVSSSSSAPARGASDLAKSPSKTSVLRRSSSSSANANA